MAKKLRTAVVLLGIALLPMSAHAHCDAADGPVATAAVRALDAGQVNLMLPFAPAGAEPELRAVFDQALNVRKHGPDAKALADRYFMETAVRLHRAGEGAPYTGLKPAGTDFGPAIPAAEEALETGKPDAVTALMTEQVGHGIAQKYRETTALRSASNEPTTQAEVAKARDRVSAELAFIGYVEGIYLAAKGGMHVEAASTQEHHHGTE